MRKYRCLKCSLIFGIEHDQCPNCGNYSIYCQEFVDEEESKELKPDFEYEYIKSISPSSDIYQKALNNYNRKDLLIYSDSLVNKANQYDLQVHSFTKERYYNVTGSFDESGRELISYHCNCDDFTYRNHCCKHIIVTLMHIYHNYCENKYGAAKELEPKKPVKSHSNIITKSSDNSSQVQAINSPNKKPNLIVHLLIGLMIGVATGFLLWGFIALLVKEYALHLWWIGFVFCIPIWLFCFLMIWIGKRKNR